MNATISKIAAGSVVAMMLVPTLAFAHDGSNKQENESNKARTERSAHASSTAAAITTSATAVQKSADAMISLEAAIGAQVGSSTQTRFDAFKQALVQAKASAALALADAASVSASTTASTTTATLAKAKLELKQAQRSLKEARNALMWVLNKLF